MTYDDEAIYQDADIEAAELEAAGNEHWAKIGRGDMLRAKGHPGDAAKCCPHSAGYGLSGTHATTANDPDAGSDTVLFRCSYCGAGLDRDPWDGDPRILNIHLSTIGRRAP